VDSLAALGVDFIKVYSLLPRDAWLAIVGAAKHAKLPFVGHLPRGVTAAEASDSGQKSIEHLEGILQACADRDSVRQAAAAAGDDRQQRQAAAVRAILATYDAGRCTDLFGRFARNGTWQTPTLVNTRNNAFFEDLRGTHSERLDYLPHYLRAWWTPERNVHLEDRTPERIAELRAISAALQKVVGDLHRAGVRLLAGTDMGGNVLNYPGWSLHDELELFVEAGLSPMEALRTATSNPAEFLGLTDSLGTIATGKLADLVLLEADPTADIRNTRRIAAVMTRGRLLDRSALDALLADVKARAGRSRRELPAAPPG
jgi:imidazolonepropionase-like amidohydrolase